MCVMTADMLTVAALVINVYFIILLNKSNSSMHCKNGDKELNTFLHHVSKHPLNP